jgi:hypothetical protein
MTAIGVGVASPTALDAAAESVQTGAWVGIPP